MMKIKTLSSGIAAAALISAIGLAYAQTTTEPAPASQTPTAVGTTPAPADMSTTQTPANSSTAPMSGNDSLADGKLTERDPRTDRN